MSAERVDALLAKAAACEQPVMRAPSPYEDPRRAIDDLRAGRIAAAGYRCEALVTLLRDQDQQRQQEAAVPLWWCVSFAALLLLITLAALGVI